MPTSTRKAKPNIKNASRQRHTPKPSHFQGEGGPLAVDEVPTAQPNNKTARSHRRTTPTEPAGNRNERNAAAQPRRNQVPQGFSGGLDAVNNFPLQIRAIQNVCEAFGAGNFRRVSASRGSRQTHLSAPYNLKISNRLSRKPPTGPRPLQIIAATIAVNIQNFAHRKQSLVFFAHQCIVIKIFTKQTAFSDLRVYKTAVSAHTKGKILKYAANIFNFFIISFIFIFCSLLYTICLFIVITFISLLVLFGQSTYLHMYLYNH